MTGSGHLFALVNDTLQLVSVGFHLVLQILHKTQHHPVIANHVTIACLQVLIKLAIVASLMHSPFRYTDLPQTTTP